MQLAEAIRIVSVVVAWEKKNKTLAMASPEDVLRFLVRRDKFGKTISHLPACLTLRGQEGPCLCSKGLAAGTIDNNIRKLRSIFKENGRGSSWNEDLHLSNPAAHPSVKRYQSLVLEEQTIARTFPTQAIPIFSDKLRIICSYLRDRIATPSLKPSNLYILSRDLAFSLGFFSGDRGSDLGQVKSADVLHLPDGVGFLINQVFDKTLRGEGNNVFDIKRIPNSPYCPVTNLRYYLALAQKVSIVLKEGFLFRVTDRRGHVLDKAFLGSAVANRLKKHLKDLQLCDGETMHSFRSGCSITLCLLVFTWSKLFGCCKACWLEKSGHGDPLLLVRQSNVLK